MADYTTVLTNGNTNTQVENQSSIVVPVVPSVDSSIPPIDNVSIKSQASIIVWHIVNSLIAGGLVMFGALVSTGHITLESFGVAVATGGVTALIQFRDFWNEEKPMFCNTNKLMSFI